MNIFKKFFNKEPIKESCDHEYGKWNPPSIHLFQSRRCKKCGWTQTSG